MSETVASTPDPAHNKLSYDGDGLDLALVLLKNFILTILTLGIYMPWARTKFRRYLWGHTSFQGDRAQYTGTGKELFSGYLKVGFLFLVVGIVGHIVNTFFPKVIAIGFSLLVPLLYVWLFAVVLYSGYRYRVARTSWRHVRFGVFRNHEEAKKFMWLYIKSALFTGLTLGFYYPYMRHNIIDFLTKRTRLGDSYFDYSGTAVEYRNIYFKGLILSFLTLGIYAPWFFLELAAYRLSHTRFQKAHLAISIPGRTLFFYSFGSMILNVMTLGLASPWMINWGLKILINNIRVEGPLDLDSIQNTAAENEKTFADSALEAFDLDIGL